MLEAIFEKFLEDLFPKIPNDILEKIPKGSTEDACRNFQKKSMVFPKVIACGFSTGIHGAISHEIRKKFCKKVPYFIFEVILRKL